MRKFVDLSNLNAINSLADLKASGICGVILKGQEGITYQDPMYEKRVGEMRAAGIPVIAEYLYYHPEDDPAKQAQNVLDNCQGVRVVVIDLEWVKNAWATNTEAVNEANLKACIGLLVASGFEIKIYTSHAFMTQYLPNALWLSVHDLWVAWYEPGPPKLPTMWRDYWGWQYGQETVPGIPQPVDVNFLNDNAVL